MDSPPIRIDPDQLAELAERIARKIVELQAPSTRPELRVDEVMQLTGHGSTSALYRWLAARRVRAISQGVYRRTAILRALGQ